jgi:hypothetical protein
MAVTRWYGPDAVRGSGSRAREVITDELAWLARGKLDRKKTERVMFWLLK